MGGWLARDKDGQLCYFHYEPYKSSAGFWEAVEDDIGIYVDKLDDVGQLRQITWEDEKATPVRIKYEI